MIAYVNECINGHLYDPANELCEICKNDQDDMDIDAADILGNLVKEAVAGGDHKQAWALERAINSLLDR